MPQWQPSFGMTVRSSKSFTDVASDETSIRSRGPSGLSRLRRRSFDGHGSRSVKRFFQDLPAWWLAALLIFAPWAYGTTFPETRQWLAEGLCGLGPLFVISLVVGRRWPRVNWLTGLLSFAILAYGWFVTWNAKLVYDPRAYYFHPGSPPAPSLPGTLDWKTSFDQMVLITGLFFAFWVTNHLSARERWRRRFWLVISLTGFSIVVLGLLQRATGAPSIFWRSDLDCGLTFFATYRYHANAGAFINIILPFVAAQCICAFRRGSSDFGKAFWIVALLLVLVSACVNLSRAATVISVGLVAILSVWQLSQIDLGQRRRISKGQFAVVAAIAAIVVAGGWLLVREIGFGDAYKHWTQLGDVITNNGRYIVYDTIEHRVLPKSGWWGLGPNTFSLVFPFFTNALGTTILGYWAQAHQDYLQTLVEWGFCGTALWFVFFGNSIVQAGTAFWRWRKTWDGRTRTFAVACLLAVGSVLVHAAVDFPMQIASLQLYSCVVLGLLASLQHADPQRDLVGSERRQRVSRQKSKAAKSRSVYYPKKKGALCIAGSRLGRKAFSFWSAFLP